jgi:hypothetical protein
MGPDEAVELYGLPLDEFVKARDAAARAARKAGDPETAAAIAALRKPTVAAWVVNRLARERRRDVDLLLDSGKRLLDAQRTSLEGGGREQLDAARTSLDGAVERLGAAARELLGPSATDVTLARVAETLRAAALSPEGRPLLASGTLTKELTETGWDLLSGLAPASPAPARGRAKEKPKRAVQPDEERQRKQALREELRAARRRRTELVRRLRAARRDEDDARETLEQAREAVRALEAELAEVDAAIERADEA